MMQKMLDISTRHITPGDATLLGERGFHEFPLTVYLKREYGWFILVSEDVEEDELREAGLSEAFVNVFRYAKAAGAGWIMLDADGDIVQLPTNDW
jgi:hypothetical protein